jgi:hypothetical protein
MHPVLPIMFGIRRVINSFFTRIFRRNVSLMPGYPGVEKYSTWPVNKDVAKQWRG